MTARLLGAAHWVRRELFGSVVSSVMTIAIAALVIWVVPKVVDWAVLRATIEGLSKKDCTPDGACWAFIRDRLPLFFYGRYPVDERWRVDTAALLFIPFFVPMMIQHLHHRWVALVALVGVYPVMAAIILRGGVFGLKPVDMSLWGGLMLNALLTFMALAASLPLGILLALGRRSRMPIFKLFSICFIEFWRGVPLLTALFVGLVMLPLFLPDGVTIDNLVRAAVALTLSTSAYMAEVVRGGLQALPRGQDEAAQALGLGYWRRQGMVILPQALHLVVPNIVNTAIELFKDTTLVVIVGLFDLLGVVNQSLKDTNWLGVAVEGYSFAALLFFACCMAMSLYSRMLERQLKRGTH